LLSKFFRRVLALELVRTVTGTIELVSLGSLLVELVTLAVVSL